MVYEMGLRKICKDIAYSAVERSNERNPLVAQTCKDGTIYIGRSLDPDWPPTLGANLFKETWKLVSDCGIYVMPHDLSQEARENFGITSYVDGVGEYVYPDFEAYGHMGWRQPTTGELYTLLCLHNKAALRGTFNTVRKNSEPWAKTSYMSSQEGSPNINEYAYKLALDFYSGETEKCLADNIKNVNIRLVRTGPIPLP